MIDKSPVDAVIETPMGLAFTLHIPISTFEVLPDKGKECKLFTHLHFNQDDLRLFGFATIGECELYKQLNRISGIGPRTALSIISTLPIPSFVKAIETEETALLTKVPGIGLKGAQRLVIELKGKLLHLIDNLEPGMPAVPESVFSEVENALQSLGFQIREIRRELNLMPADAAVMNAEGLIKEIIRRIYQRSK
ncbi:MAG: Holliday junction branch migration protein RuvA [Candidatus Syntrophosphaera sp.]